MFQYAAGRALALRRGTRPSAGSWLARAPQPVRLRAGCLPARCRADLGLSAHAPAASSRTAASRAARRTAGLAPRGLHIRPEGARPTGARASGRLLAEREVLRRLRGGDPGRLRSSTSPWTSATPPSPTRSPRATAVAVHVRRGDYVTDPVARSFVRALPVDYYIAAADARARSCSRRALLRLLRRAGVVPRPRAARRPDDDRRLQPRAGPRRPAADDALPAPHHREQLIQLVGSLARATRRSARGGAAAGGVSNSDAGDVIPDRW